MYWSMPKGVGLFLLSKLSIIIEKYLTIKSKIII